MDLKELYQQCINEISEVEAAKIINKIIKIAEETNNKEYLIAGYLGRSGWNLRVSNIEGAKADAEKVINFFDNTPKTVRYGRAENILAIASDIYGDYIEAAEHYMKAIICAEEFGDLIDLGLYYNNIANIFVEYEEYNKVKEYAEKAISILKNTDDNIFIYYSYRNLCIAYFGLSKYDEFANVIEYWENEYDKSPNSDVKSLLSLQQSKLCLALLDGRCNDFRDIFNDIMNKIDNYYDEDIFKELMYDSINWINYGYINETKRFFNLYNDKYKNNKILNIEKLYNYAMIKLCDFLDDKVNRKEYVNKYYEITEIQRDKLKSKIHENVIRQIEIHNMKKKILEEEKNANFDSLTELYNRRILNSSINDRFEEIKNSNLNFGIAFIDVDNFKNYNDTFEHIEGDICLKTVAKEIKNIALNNRENVFAIRYGGDEFLILFVNDNADNIFAICEELRQKIEMYEMPNPDTEKKIVTLSIGAVDEKLCKNSSLYDIIISADRKLYKSKETRNTLTM